MSTSETKGKRLTKEQVYAFAQDAWDVYRKTNEPHSFCMYHRSMVSQGQGKEALLLMLHFFDMCILESKYSMIPCPGAGESVPRFAEVMKMAQDIPLKGASPEEHSLVSNIKHLFTEICHFLGQYHEKPKGDWERHLVELNCLRPLAALPDGFTFDIEANKELVDSPFFAVDENLDGLKTFNKHVAELVLEHVSRKRSRSDEEDEELPEPKRACV